jgi:hypothetical protein
MDGTIAGQAGPGSEQFYGCILREFEPELIRKRLNL